MRILVSPVNEAWCCQCPLCGCVFTINPHGHALGWCLQCGAEFKLDPNRMQPAVFVVREENE